MEFIKVEDKNNLVRDTTNNSIINTDFDNYKKYVDFYRQKFYESKKITSLENEVSSLKEDISEIKSLLQNIVNNKLL